MIKIPSIAFLIFALNGGSAFAANLMLDFGATAVADPYLTLSPGHSSGFVPAGQTSWNTISSATPPSSLRYADGSTATGVVFRLGQESTGGSNSINFGTSITSTTLAGTGGGIAGKEKLFGVGSIYGDDASSTAAGRDGFFGGGGAKSDGAAIGMSLTGLAAGNYQVYIMARNTNSNDTSYPMNIYTSVGAASETFDFSALSGTTQSNVGHASGDPYIGQYKNFVNGENYVQISVTITEGQTLFLAVDGGDNSIDRRGFLNMVQIVQVPEPTACVLMSGAWLFFGFRRRR